MRAGSLQAGCARPRPSGMTKPATDDALDASAAARPSVPAACSQAHSGATCVCDRHVQAVPCSRSTLAGPPDAGGMQPWPAAQQAQHRHHAGAAAGSRALGVQSHFSQVLGALMGRNGVFGAVVALQGVRKNAAMGSGIFIYLHYLAAVSMAACNEAFRDARRPTHKMYG